MKRTFAIFVWLLFSSLFSLGNSAPPVAAFSEFLIDSLGNWTMELRLNFPVGIDSIEIGFSSGNSMVEQYELIPPGDYTLIDNSNLSTPLTVNSEGDYIIVRSWGSGYWHADSLAYGNYPGATLDCAEYGSSYASINIDYFFAYAIDNSPTLGIENDTSGAVSNFSGKIYDPNGNLITTGTLIFGPEDLRYPIYAGGSFNGPIFAHRYYCDSIIIRSSSQPYTYTLYTIDPVEFCETPGSLIYEEIICTAIVDITDYYEEKVRVIVSPNPFSSYIRKEKQNL